MIKELEKEYENGLYLGSAEFDYLMLMKVKDKNVKTFKMHDETKFIQSKAFYECEDLENIKIANTVESIGDFAFYKCSSLKSVVIPKSVTAIGSSAFLSCPNLTIFAMASEKPDGWVCKDFSKWKSNKTNVIWDYEEDVEHTYTFETNTSDKLQAIKAKGFIELPKPEKDGYLFGGWYENSEFTGNKYKTTYFNKEDIKLYAKWIECKEIQLLEIKKVDITKNGEYKFFKFIPKESKDYVIKSLGDYGTYAYLFDSDMDRLITSGGMGMNFELDYSFLKDHTYYIRVEMAKENQVGSFDVEVINSNIIKKENPSEN